MGKRKSDDYGCKRKGKLMMKIKKGDKANLSGLNGENFVNESGRGRAEFSLATTEEKGKRSSR